MLNIANRGFEREFKFRASRSGGKGGQHVNKVSTKVELVFNIPKSKILDVDEKVLLKERWAHKLSSKGDLRIVTQLFRSQLKNKEISKERFYKMLEKALKKPKYRMPTAPGKAAIEKRFQSKRVISEKKQGRKKIDLNRMGN